MERSRISGGMKNKLVLVCRVFLGILFIYASLDKIIHLQDFAKQIGNYKVLPFGLENLLAIILPWTEFIVGFALLLGVMIDGATVLSIIMMLVFILVVSQAMLRGIDITCGCFKVSADSEKLGLNTIIRDIVFLLMSYIVLNRSDRKIEIFPKNQIEHH